MTPEELASNSRKEENAKIREHAMWDAERGPSKKATTDQFQCGKCRQRKCTYYVRFLPRILVTVRIVSKRASNIYTHAPSILRGVNLSA